MASQKYSNFDQLAIAYLGFMQFLMRLLYIILFEVLSNNEKGFGKWQPTQHEDQLSLSYLIANKNSLSFHGKAALSLVLLQNREWDDGIVTSLLHELESSFRVQGTFLKIQFTHRDFF